MAFCLIKPLAEQFKKDLKDGTLNPDKLYDMSTPERRAFFGSRYGGETNGREINGLFESKMVLKDFKKGAIDWAKQVSGLKPEVRRDFLARVEKLDHVLNPGEEELFLQDLVSKKVGTEVTYEQAQKINELAKKAEEAKADMSTEAKRVEYGKAYLEFKDYVDSISPNSVTLADNIFGLARSIKVIGDLGMPFRQGWGMISRPQWATAFGSMFKYLMSEKYFQGLRSDIVSRPNYLNGAYKKAGLRLGPLLSQKVAQREEDWMTTYAGKLPIVKNIERANIGFIYKLRADVFDLLHESAELSGENVKDPEVLHQLANVVNDFTASGNLGENDQFANLAPKLNATFFSARKISATINMMNPKRYVTGSPTARKAAQRQLIGSLMLSAAFLGIAAAFGAKVETDPNSSDFGKFVVGKYHVDVTGGNATYATLLKRIITGKSKSSTTGKETKLGTGYKGQTRADLMVNFTRNKLAPLAAVVADYFFQTDQPDLLRGEFTVKNELRNTFEPMLINDFIDLVLEGDSLSIPFFLMGYFGNSVNKY